jgi:hypothetical protein
MAMNSDELRRIALEAPSRKAREEQQAEERKSQIRKQELREKEWTLATQAVAEMTDNIKKAAAEGKFEMVVYTAWANAIFHIECRAKFSRWDGHLKKETFTYVVPDYAQYVFDHCPSQLKPRWVPSDRWVVLGPGCSDHHPGYRDEPSHGTYIALVVSW